MSKLKRQMQPRVTIFISKKNDYIVWTKEGFFDASENGAKYIGYHINHGANRESEFVSVDSLYKSFYKPALVQRALRGEDLTLYGKEINIEKILADGLAPKVQILTPSGVIEGNTVPLKFTLQERGGGVGDVRIYRNGTLVSHKTKAVRVEMDNERSQKVTLEEGENIFKIIAFNRANNIESDPAFVTIHAKTSYYNAKLKLFVLLSYR